MISYLTQSHLKAKVKPFLCLRIQSSIFLTDVAKDLYHNNQIQSRCTVQYLPNGNHIAYSIQLHQTKKYSVGSLK